MTLEREIEGIIFDKLQELNRPDLFRMPLVAFSSAADERYIELKQIIGGWHQTPAELLPGAVSVVSYFIPFTREVVAQPKTVPDGAPLWSEAYQVINRHFVAIGDAVAAHLRAAGHAALTIRPTHTYDPKDLQCFWSHRSAAAIAGLGSFGANRLLITAKGSGGRFCSVITTAPLAANTTPAPERCLYVTHGACGQCFKICPVGTLAPGTMDKFRCQDELNKNGARTRAATGLESADTCGKCISVCPVAYME